VVKIAVIQDADLFATIEESVDNLVAIEPRLTTTCIKRAVALKAALVERDERETLGVRAVLNYGHTLGHAIEAASGYSGYLHGEAVAVGMRAAAHIAQRMGLHPPDAVERQGQLLSSLGLPQHCVDVSRDGLLAGIGLDKKRSGGRTTWILPRGLGDVLVTADVPQAYVEEAIALVHGPAAL
jgi:3-dehydroquinate synthase